MRGGRPSPSGSRPLLWRPWRIVGFVIAAVGLVVFNVLSYSRRACLERELAVAAASSDAGAAASSLQAEVRRLQAQVAYLTSDAASGGARERVVHAPPPQAPAVPPPPPTGVTLEPAPISPASARALLVICHNRPAYLERTLAAVLDRLPLYNRPHVYVSQDGDVASVTRVIIEAAAAFSARAPDVPFTHWVHPPLPPSALRGAAAWATGYYALAGHFGWALGRLFGSPLEHPRVIVLEDDLEISVDFFDYFTALEPLLDADATLLAASAYSDLGQSHLITPNHHAVLRSDFFPGLGWMLTRHVWEELGPKWPDSFWDDWLREPPQRKGRHFLRPEVSRTITFGEQGVSQSQFFAQFLATVVLNTEPVDWAQEDLQYLQLAVWDEDWSAAIKRARVVPTLEAFFDAECAATPPGADPTPPVAFVYGALADYPAVAHRFSYLDDAKAGVPRTAYKGGVIVQHKGCAKLALPG